MKKALLASLLALFCSTASLAAAKTAPSLVQLQSHEFTAAQNSYLVIWRYEMDRDQGGVASHEIHALTFRGSWNVAAKKATEEITHTLMASGVEKAANPMGANYRVTATCKEDPWLSEKPGCSGWQQARTDKETAAGDPYDFFFSAPNPKSAVLLVADVKKALREERAAKKLPASPAAMAGAAPAPQKAQAAAAPAPVLGPPKVLAPKPDEAVAPDAKLHLQVQIPQKAPLTTVVLEFAAKESGAWAKRVMIDGYDTKANPKGLDLRYEQFPVAGDWRVRARLDRAGAPWSGWVNFTVR